MEVRTITAQELMLGDWVETPDYITRVESIGPHSVLCEGIVRWLDQVEVQPVPLTVEILERNGFTPTGGGDKSYMLATPIGIPELRY